MEGSSAMQVARSTLPRLAAIVVVIAGAFALAGPVLAQEPGRDGAVIVNVRADAEVAAGEAREVVVVVDGDARIAGEAETVVVVDGSATLTGARVETLFVARGAASIDASSTVGTVRTLDATYEAESGATVGDVGTVDPGLIAAAIVPIAIATWIGIILATLLAGLVVAAIGGSQIRRAGWAITTEPGPVLVGAIVVLIGLPMLAVLAFVTVVGVSAGLAILFIVLPLLWFLGSVAVAVRIGDWILGQARGRPDGPHPVASAFVGLLIVGVLSIVPILGFLIGLLGAGAVALIAWRAAFGRPARVGTGDVRAVGA